MSRNAAVIFILGKKMQICPSGTEQGVVVHGVLAMTRIINEEILLS